MPETRVSIVISAYDVQDYLPETLDSALNQSYPACDITVVDDGSTDATPEILARYSDRIRVVRQPNSGGPSRPRNVGIAASTGELVALCDGDDILEPDAVAAAVAVFDTLPEVALLWGDFETIDAHGRPAGRRWSHEYTSFRKHLAATALDDCYRLPAEAGFSNLLRGLFVGISSVVLRRSVLQEIGNFDETLLNGDDRDLWLRLARAGHDFVYRDAVTFQYRVHDANISGRGYRRLPAMINVLERQIPFITDEDLDRDVSEKIDSYRIAYADGLRRAGVFAASRRAFIENLRARPRWNAALGLILAWLRIRRGRTA